MSVETLQTMAFIFFVMSGGFFLIAVCLFFVFNIPGIIGNLSGMTAKKAIKNIQTQNEEGDRERIGYLHLDRQTGAFRHGKTTRKSNKFEKTASLGKKVNETVRLNAVDMAEVKETAILSTNRKEGNLTRLLDELPEFTVDVDIVLCESTEAIE